MSFFFSSSFDAATTATAINVASADVIEAPSKDGSDEEVADGTAEADGALARPRHSGWRRWLVLVIINITQQTSVKATDKYLKLNMILKNQFNILRSHSLVLSTSPRRRGVLGLKTEDSIRSQHQLLTTIRQTILRRPTTY